MLLIHVAVVFLTLTCAFSNQYELFDNKNITSLIIIDSEEASLNITERQIQCQRYGLVLPSIENHVSDLIAALGHWKTNGFLIENNIWAVAFPSINVQKVLILDAANFTKKREIMDKLVCTQSKHVSNTSIIPIIIIIIFALPFIVIIAMLTLIRNKNENQQQQPYFRRLWF